MIPLGKKMRRLIYVFARVCMCVGGPHLKWILAQCQVAISFYPPRNKRAAKMERVQGIMSISSLNENGGESEKKRRL